MCTAAVCLDIEKAFDTTQHHGFLYELLKLKFSVNTVKHISSFLLNRKYKVSVKDHLSTSREINAGVQQGSVLSSLLHNLYTNDVPQTPGTYLSLCADDTCIYTTDRNKGLCYQEIAAQPYVTVVAM
jgi:retron-type reverse transcriptase